MAKTHPRLARERKTITAMVRLYCRGQHHSQGELCTECQRLLDYAWARLDKCAFQEGKTTCAKCPVHCYKPDMRQQIRTVMGYAGPRMWYRHPVLTLFHLIDGRREEPLRPEKT